MKRTFEFNDEKLSKSWTIETNGNEFTVTLGKTGTNGQSQIKSFAMGFMPENLYPNFKAGDYSAENYDVKNLDLHRPYVDNIVLVSPSSKPMRRELDLIDVWFDSGAMPFAQVHWPFENSLKEVD